MGADEPRFRVLHVSNISMTATREQIYQLFAFIGRIDEFKIYPSDNHPQLSTFTQKFAYVKFEDQKSVEVAQHLTNTVFIDRALVCIPSISDTIPDEDTALKTGGPAWPGQRQLPPNVVNQIQDLGDGQQMLCRLQIAVETLIAVCPVSPVYSVVHPMTCVSVDLREAVNFEGSKKVQNNREISCLAGWNSLAILSGMKFMEIALTENSAVALLTVDPTLAALGLPPYPTLSANTEASKVEEIRRTVYVGNIPKDCVGEEVMKFFNDSIGEAELLKNAMTLFKCTICCYHANTI
ncbi:Splicing regulatory glutamine/lysine-rich protein 1 [Dirofilaria immitis]|nr:Splicing regulatory glutamine/lysine-rich protein 1 [Dirofilaria immitis]